MGNDPNHGIPYHPPHRWSGMPDREAYQGTLYQRSELEREVARVVSKVFRCLFGDSSD